jgi:hypothetical protein
MKPQLPNLKLQTKNLRCTHGIITSLVAQKYPPDTQLCWIAGILRTGIKGLMNSRDCIDIPGDPSILNPVQTMNEASTANPKLQTKNLR